MDNKLKTNARSVGTETQYEIRKSIIRLLKSGKSGREVAKLLSVSEGHVSNTKKSYDEKGIEGLKIGQRGRKEGENRSLTPEQEEEIKNIIIDKTPEQLNFKECMWNRKNIRELILRKYNIDMPLSTLGYYLQRWGLTVQRPVKRAYKQDEKKINDWINKEFDNINKRAKEENAEIFFGDETGIQNTSNYLKGYAPIGKTPIVKVTSKKIKINMLSAVSKRGKLRFMLYKENMTSAKLIDFMYRLTINSKLKVFLILDNLSVHHSKKVTKWLEKHKEKIEVFYLPPYAPEYNPDELVNSDLKRSIGKKKLSCSDKELEHKIRSHLKGLQLNSKKISSFFNAPYTSYAA